MTDTTAAPPLRVALLGYGLAGRVFHGPLVSATPGLRLSAIVTADPGRSAQARADHPAARVLPTAEDVWADAGSFDLVVVATGNAAHVPQTARALGLGLAVVVDKPMAPDAASAEALAAQAEAAGLLLTVFQNRRWDYDVLTARRLLARGDLGRPHRLELRFERWRPQPGDSWREAGPAPDLPGLLYDLGAHLVDQALHLLGPAVAVMASARSVRVPGRPDDDTQVWLQHASGAVSLLSASSAAALTGPRLRLLGTAGGYEAAALDGQEDALRAGRHPGDAGWGVEPMPGTVVGIDGTPRAEPGDAGRWPDFYPAVAAAVRGSAPPPVPPRDVVANLRVLDAARASAREGIVVRLEPPAGHTGDGRP